MVLYYEQKCTHTIQTTVCFSFTGQSSFFHGLCMCRPFVSTLRRLRREQCKANACFPLSQVWSPVPWEPPPAPVLFCPSLHVYTLSSESAFFQSGSSDFPRFAESNLLHAKYLADTSKSLEGNFHKLC